MEWNEPLFAEGSGPNGRVGVLVSHGFGGSPRSVQELALRLVDAGYTHVVPPANQLEIYGAISSADKTLIELLDSCHVATMDNDKERIFAGILEFVPGHLPASRR